MQFRSQFAATLCVAATFWCSPYVGHAQQTNPNQEFEQIKNQITVKQSLRSDKEQERAELRRQIQSVQDELEGLVRQHTRLQSQLEISEKQVEDSTENLKEYAALRDQKATEFVWNTVTSEQLESRNPLTILIVQSDPLKVDRLFHYHQYFVEHLETQLTELQQVLKTFDELLADTESARLEFAGVQQDFESNRTSLLDRQRQFSSLNEQLETEIATLDQDLAQLFRERERLSQVIEERAPRTSRTTPTPAPVSRSDISTWPVLGALRQRFGMSRADGRIRSEGIVIDSELGTPVTAVASGIVIYAQWLEGYGNTLIIDHGDEVISLYARCDALYKRESDPVEAGEVIGSVGVGGDDPQAGLYFEIRVRSEPVDPMRWLRRP